MINFQTVKTVVKVAGKIASAVSLITGVVDLGFKAKDAFEQHAEAKAKLVEATAEEVLSDEELSDEEVIDAELTE